MKISFRYDDGVAVIPKKVLDKSAAQASREDLLVLLSLAADPAVPAAERTEALGIGKDELEQSISFWKRNKIISVELDEGEKLPAYKKKNAESDSEASSSSAKSASVKRHLRDNSLPTYTADELASALDVPDSRKLIEYCQQSFGRIFNMSESEKVIGIVDYLGVSTDYVAMLCSHLAADGKRSVRALETEARDHRFSGAYRISRSPREKRCARSTGAKAFRDRQAHAHSEGEGICRSMDEVRSSV